MAQLLLETSVANSPELEELAEKIGKDARVLGTKHLDGSEIAKLVIENFPAYITLIITIVQLCRKKNVELTIRKEGGKKIINPTEDEAQKFLTQKDGNEGAE